MKKFIFDIIQISIFLVLVSCSKEKVCNKLPLGTYTGEFITPNGNQLPNQTMQLIRPLKIISLIFAPNDTEMWLHVHHESRSLQIGFCTFKTFLFLNKTL